MYISKEEIREELKKKKKNGKTPGDDGNPTTIFITLRDDGGDAMQRSFCVAREIGHVPREWRRTFICPIYMRKKNKKR